MPINIYSMLAVSCALLSLFLPWVSIVMFLSTDYHSFYNFLHYGPLTMASDQKLFSHADAELESNVGGGYNRLGWLHPLIIASYLRHGLVGDSYTMMSFLDYIYVFSVCFLIGELFTTSIWNRVTKRDFLVTLSLLLLGMFLYVVFESWWCNGVVHSMDECAYATRMAANNEAFYVNSTTLDAGFYFGLMSIIFVSLSYLNPKFIKLPIKPKTRLFNKFKEYWLAVPDRQKLPVNFLIALILTWLLGFLLFGLQLQILFGNIFFNVISK